MKTWKSFDGTNVRLSYGESNKPSHYEHESYIGFKLFILCMVLMTVFTVAVLVLKNLG
jgi:hypothetical protein